MFACSTSVPRPLTPWRSADKAAKNNQKNGERTYSWPRYFIKLSPGSPNHLLIFTTAIEDDLLCSAATNATPPVQVVSDRVRKILKTLPLSGMSSKYCSQRRLRIRMLLASWLFVPVRGRWASLALNTVYKLFRKNTSHRRI